jgi:hypothetical protein
MVEHSGGSAYRRSRRRYFYLDNRLHVLLRVNRPSNIAEAWDFVKDEPVVYVWSDLKRRMGQAYRTSQAAKFLHRSVDRIMLPIKEEKVPAPQRPYDLETGGQGRFYWSDQDIKNMHEYLLTLHRGRPRKDGKTTPWNLPSRPELRAMLEHGTVLYTKTKDGRFVPVWSERDWQG